jgi:ankyrin repeat protein
LRDVWNPKQQTAIVDLLLQHGADIEHADRGGITALHRAVRARSPEAVHQLLKAGAKVDSRLGKQQSTPLHLAVHSTGASGTAGARDEQIRIIGILLQYGADPKIPDATGKSAYDAARNTHVRTALAGS